MILPSKHLSRERALLTVGAGILRILTRPMTESAIWEELRRPLSHTDEVPTLGYDGFVLALDLLFLVGAIELRDGLLSKGSR